MLDNIRAGKSWVVVDTAVVPEASSNRYIEPQVTVAEGDIESSRFVVISSAGAVGKSALAAHMAQTRNAVVWDLSKVRLGSNSFLGTLAKTFGVDRLQDALGGIHRGEMLLVFDALDEAEIHSGRDGVDIFVSEVRALAGSGGGTPIVFLGRPDSAKRVFSALKESGADGCLLQLGYFDHDAAVEFCYEAFARKRADAPAYAQVFRRKLEEIFASGMAGDSSAAADWSKESQEFYGYAPVLQAIAAVLVGETNLHNFQTTDNWSRGKFICNVMESICVREQNKFLSNASLLQLNTAVGSDTYSLDDQVLRLLKFTVGDPSWSEAVANDPVDATELTKAMQSFLPQHPFVSEAQSGTKGEFSGPAFRDFCLAFALRSASDDLRLFAELFLLDNPIVSSPVLFDVYTEVGGGKIASEHIDAVYFSFASAVGKSACRVDVYDDAGGSTLMLGNGDLDVVFDIENDGGIVFTGALHNAQVDTNRTLSLEALDQFEIGDSDIAADKVAFKCSSLGVVGQVSVVAAGVEHPTTGALVIRPRQDAVLSVTFPGSERHPWASYHSPATDEINGSEAEKLAHTLGRILRWFRKDRRADFARYRDLIRKHIVGRGGNAQQAFDFLQKVGAVEERGNLYVLKADVLDAYGIRWAGGSSEIDPRLLARLNEYLAAG